MTAPPPPRTAADYAAASALFCLHRTTCTYISTLSSAPLFPAPLHQHDISAAQTLYSLSLASTTPAPPDDMETEDDDAAGAKNRGKGYREFTAEEGGAKVGDGGLYPTPSWTGSEEVVEREERVERVREEEGGGGLRKAVVTKSGRESRRPKRWGG